ncbi:hypothetical protein CEY12_07795 [Chryseobacterium sp. T16E-39]|uniref:hypothetical protein n=1 Tax=Chryseobacterium sp. T16E-39 TaxID=2015076 RepID=UPI000B5B3DBC|nr:hypothetical protein [Chryseobacterium sp. T16E-39]ASK30016.1 hypothetical protein CEY12_07795 [Chryseobacterium sp. T16E-39]
MKLTNEEAALHDKMAEKLPELIEEYFQRPEITSLGVALKTINNSLTQTLSYTFGVKKKLALSEVTHPIPSAIFGCPTDVIELEIDQEPLSSDDVTEVTTRNEKTDPLIGGISISANGTLKKRGKEVASSGTLGVMVHKRTDDKPYMMTCAHVLVGSSTRLDSDVCQQSKWRTTLNYCHDCATLKDYYYENVLVPRDFKTINVWLDCAIARKGEHRNATIGKVFGVDEIIEGFATIDAFIIGEKVRKSGITSDITTGNITSITSTLKLPDFDGNTVFANNLIMIQGEDGLFSRSGDSGSAIFTTENPRLVGILGGATLSGSPTYASAADAILSKWPDLSF